MFSGIIFSLNIASFPYLKFWILRAQKKGGKKDKTSERHAVSHKMDFLNELLFWIPWKPAYKNLGFKHLLG